MSIIEHIKSIQTRDPASPTFMEVCLGYNGFHAVLLHRVNHMIWGWGLRALARFLANISRILTGVEIHPEAYIGKRLFIDHGHGVVIGQTAIIGDDVTIYQGVTLGGYGLSKDKGLKRHPTVMDHAMIGAYAQVLGDVLIGKSAKIGANSVVTSDIPDGATALGVPARIICRNDEERAYGMPSKQEIEKITFVFESISSEIEKRKKHSADDEKPSASKKKSAAS